MCGAKARLPRRIALFPVDFAPSARRDHRPHDGPYNGKCNRCPDLHSARANATEAPARTGREPNAQAGSTSDAKTNQGIPLAMALLLDRNPRNLLLGEHLLPFAGSHSDCFAADPVDPAADGASTGGDSYF